jgi:hypothetical protein
MLKTLCDNFESLRGAASAAQSAETIHLILEHLSSNGRAKMARAADAGVTTFTRAGQ